MTTAPVKGDRYEWRATPDTGVVRCLVTRVAQDNSWVDLLCQEGQEEWTKRMRFPLPKTFKLVVKKITFKK